MIDTNTYGTEILPKLRHAADGGDQRHECRWLQERGLLHLLLQGRRFHARLHDGGND